MKLFSFRNFRVLALLIALAVTWIYTRQQERDSTSWLQPLEVVIYPINATGSTESKRFIAGLSTDSFSEIDHFFDRESEKFRLLTRSPTTTSLGAEITELPPEAPVNGSTLDIMLWSIKFRYWAWQNTPDNRSNKHRIRIFAIYHDPATDTALPHSLGITKGLIGIVHAFADEKQQPQNNIIITHEILHTVGASDKYDQSTGRPTQPYGLAEPARKPLYPQYRAEIMAGRVAISELKWRMAESLERSVIGYKTAAEIGWTKAGL